MKHQRKYTADEIDALRSACETKWLFGAFHPTGGISRMYQAGEKDVAVEAMVRTYMEAGLRASDLYKEIL